MTVWDYIIFAIALCVGVPAMLRNWTAVGLILSFAVIEAVWVFTYRPIPLVINVSCDYMVLVIVFLKTGARECLPLPGLHGVAWNCWLQLSRSDKLIVSLFLPGFLAYGLEPANPWRFYTLWTIGLLQFLAAGVEAFASWRRGRVGNTTAAHPADWFLRQRYAGHEW